VRDAFGRFATNVARLSGSPLFFVANVLLIIVWLATGPLLGYSDTWQLVVNTATTVITYLLVFIIQNTLNRDSKALHAKLDALIDALEDADSSLERIEDSTDEEIEAHRPGNPNRGRTAGGAG
jgi:low affinity Fe/Cu permease